MNTQSQICNVLWSQTSNELVSTHGYSHDWRDSNHSAFLFVHIPETMSDKPFTVALWRYGPTIERVGTLHGHSYRVLYLAMSPDVRERLFFYSPTYSSTLTLLAQGETIVSGAGDETLRFWKVRRRMSSMIEPGQKLTAPICRCSPSDIRVAAAHLVCRSTSSLKSDSFALSFRFCLHLPALAAFVRSFLVLPCHRSGCTHTSVPFALFRILRTLALCNSTHLIHAGQRIGDNDISLL